MSSKSSELIGPPREKRSASWAPELLHSKMWMWKYLSFWGIDSEEVLGVCIFSRASSVREGRLMLNVIMGFGESVRVVKEDKVIAAARDSPGRGFRFSIERITTECGTWRIN